MSGRRHTLLMGAALTAATCLVGPVQPSHAVGYALHAAGASDQNACMYVSVHEKQFISYDESRSLIIPHLQVQEGAEEAKDPCRRVHTVWRFPEDIRSV